MARLIDKVCKAAGVAMQRGEATLTLGAEDWTAVLAALALIDEDDEALIFVVSDEDDHAGN